MKEDIRKKNKGPNSKSIMNNTIIADEISKMQMSDKTNIHLPKEVKYSPKDNGMGDLSRDRFGVPVENKGTIFKTPGPGAYNSNQIDATKQNPSKQGLFTQEARNLKFTLGTAKINPGPAYYTPNIIDKVSFHYSRVD
mmetsp:Transcript_6708/g.5837  ORF Transcript_6708/g.5837 Transcript_6708/m.5837 type:complete len:138 (+) Transcript_6708:365-778(+)